MGKKIQLEGMRFGRLTVVAEGGRSKNRQITWICQCDCGKITHPIMSTQLLHGVTRSCGCLRDDLTRSRSVTHGLSGTQIYGVWHTMKNRCLNPNTKKYKDYGARDIKVCEEWLHDFQAFYDWAMANGYHEGLSIDRINVNGNYCPENCRWVDMKTQSNNKGNNRVIEIDGESKTIAEWASVTGIDYATIYMRFKRGVTGSNLIKEVGSQ